MPAAAGGLGGSAPIKMKGGETMRERGELTFLTSIGGRRTIRVPDPMPIVTENILDLAESGIIAANPFDETIGDLEKLMRAERVSVSRTKLI